MGSLKNYDSLQWFTVEGFQRDKVWCMIQCPDLAESAKDHFEKAFESFNIHCKEGEKFEFWIDEEEDYSLMYRAYSNQISKKASCLLSTWVSWLNEVDAEREIFNNTGGLKHGVKNP